MKTLFAAALVLAATASFAQTYKVDPAATKVSYVGKKVTGEHTGNVSVKSGSLTVDKDVLSAGEVVVDMNSMTSTDITDKEMNAKYLGHMKSADFFDTAKYPEAKLVIKSSKKNDKGLEVKGDLTFIGKTNPVTFQVTDIKKTDAAFSGKSNLVINRTLWGLKYGSSSFIKGLGDKAINDEFTLAIDLSAKK